MSGRRRGGDGGLPLGVARNKHGTPLYSRQDIREQYCINDKELKALETKKKPLFGCLVTHSPQPASSSSKRRSLLPACLRSRAPSDENIYSRSHSNLTGPGGGSSPRTRGRGSDYDDEPFSRRRPNTICYTDPKRLASLDSNLNGRGGSVRLSSTSSAAPEPHLQPLTASTSLGAPPHGDGGRQTQFGLKASGYHSADFLNNQDGPTDPYGYEVRRTSSTQPNTPDLGGGHGGRVRPLPQPLLDDRHIAPKHVSFQKGMSRSTTLSGSPDDATREMQCPPTNTLPCLNIEPCPPPPAHIPSTRTQDASTGSSTAVYRTQDAATGPAPTVRTHDVSIGPSGVRTQDAATGAGCSAGVCSSSASQERLLDGRCRSPDSGGVPKMEQSQILTAAMLQEKMKRTCMRSQATQTDLAQPSQAFGKSLPHLDLCTSEDDKALMVSQAAQTSGGLYTDGHRRLVKSLSEAANSEGIQYDLYDLDTLNSISRGHPEIRMHRAPSFDVAEEDFSTSLLETKDHSQSSDVFLEESPVRYKKGVLQKTLSEGEILQEKRRAMTLASGFVDVDINGYHGSEEDLIEPQCVDECSIDLSHSRIFSQESLLDEEELEEESFHENILVDDSEECTCDRRISVISSDSDLRSADINELRKENHLPYQLEVISAEVPPTLEEESPDISPVDASSLHDALDGCEESVSESQVTVVPRKLGFSGSGQLVTSDSENGSTHLLEHSGKSLYVKQNSLHGSSFEEDEEPVRLRIPGAKVSTTNLSSISDEQTSVSDNVITECSQGLASPSSTSSECDKAIASSTDDYGSVFSGDSMTVRSDGFDHDFEDQDLIIEENYMERLVQELKGSEFSPSKLHTKIPETRKMVSPESDSSSSHFTEQETSRATNTVNSKSDLSRTDSHPINDNSQSETSDDYVSATDGSVNDADSRKSVINLDERHVSSPPRMEDIVEDEMVTPKILSPETSKTYVDACENTDGINSDFETAQDLTSPVSDTTTSASYHIDYCEEFDRVPELRFKPELPPKNSASLPKPVVPPKPERFSPCRESRERPLKLDANKAVTTGPLSDVPMKQPAEISTRTDDSHKHRVETASRSNNISKTSRTLSDINSNQRDDAENKRFSRYFDLDSNTTEDSADNQGDGEDSDSENQQDLWSEEEREKLKLGMKLNFPPGVSMYGEVPQQWHKGLNENDIKKLKIYDGKPKKSVKIDLTDSKKPSRSRSQSPKELQNARSPVADRKVLKDKPKCKTPEEVTTPGMVRSPAMHEGFRLQDWTPVRTPVTPEKVNDFDTSDDSCNDHSPRNPKTRSPNRPAKDQRRKSKETARKNEEPISHSKSSADHRGPNWYNTSQEKCEVNAKEGSPSSWQETRHSPNLPTYRRDSLMHESPVPTDIEPNYTGHVADKSDSHMTLCTQCGERPASREGILRSTPSPQQLIAAAQAAHHQQYAHQFFVMQKSPSLQHTAYHPEMSMSLPRPRHVPLRARSEERSALGRDWTYSGHSLEWGDHPRQDTGEDDERGVHCGAYRASPWLLLAAWDELRVWRKDSGPPLPIPPHVRIKGFDSDDDNDDDTLGDGPLARRGSGDSTCSEKDFRRKYQAVTHRLVHRKASIEMFRRLTNNNFQSDKTVLVSRASGEFGFRIHGSRPVVVSAIESDTPAETSGLEVGDIVLSINGISVLEASHSEVVKLAHSGGCDTLRLEVARTCNLLAPLVTTDPTPVCAGYLYKLGAAHRAPGSSAITRRWHRRWFALTKDHCLYHYKSESDPHPLGAVVLRGHTVHAFSTASRPYAFTVCLAGEVGLQLAAHTAEARGRWGHVITQASEQAAQRDELLEASSRRVQQAPGTIAAPDCFGFLHRLGARWHQWKKRYCVLKDACLYLYHDTDATQAIGVVHLHGYRVQSTSIGGKKHAFELLPPEPKFRHFYFHADSENDKKRWLAALEYSIDRWIKVG